MKNKKNSQALNDNEKAPRGVHGANECSLGGQGTINKNRTFEYAK